MTINGQVSGHAAHILIDSGATDMFVSKKWIEKNQLAPTTLGRPLQVELVDGKTKENITDSLEAEITIGQFKTREKLHVITLGRYDLVLGINWLEKYNPSID